MNTTAYEYKQVNASGHHASPEKEIRKNNHSTLEAGDSDSTASYSGSNTSGDMMNFNFSNSNDLPALENLQNPICSSSHVSTSISDTKFLETNPAYDEDDEDDMPATIDNAIDPLEDIFIQKMLKKRVKMEDVPAEFEQERLRRMVPMMRQTKAYKKLQVGHANEMWDDELAQAALELAAEKSAPFSTSETPESSERIGNDIFGRKPPLLRSKPSEYRDDIIVSNDDEESEDVPLPIGKFAFAEVDKSSAFKNNNQKSAPHLFYENSTAKIPQKRDRRVTFSYIYSDGLQVTNHKGVSESLESCTPPKRISTESEMDLPPLPPQLTTDQSEESGKNGTIPNKLIGMTIESSLPQNVDEHPGLEALSPMQISFVVESQDDADKNVSLMATCVEEDMHKDSATHTLAPPFASLEAPEVSNLVGIGKNENVRESKVGFTNANREINKCVSGDKVIHGNKERKGLPLNFLWRKKATLSNITPHELGCNIQPVDSTTPSKRKIKRLFQSLFTKSGFSKEKESLATPLVLISTDSHIPPSTDHTPSNS